MGIYLNPGNMDYQKALNSEIYIDKSLLIHETNQRINTEQCYICVSRPRRFGKSMAANMLTAYYSAGCDSKELFEQLQISQSPDYEKHLNKYNVIHFNVQTFLNRSKTMSDMLTLIEKRIGRELKRHFSPIDFPEEDLIFILQEIYAETGQSFIFIIDEWDCVFRIHKSNFEAQKQYLDFLQNLLKGQTYVALAYMTGILPIKKYGQHSALNMFNEFSMTNQREFSEYTGFTENEVQTLCEKYGMDFDKTKQWYDGYNVRGISIYNPRSVVMSMTGHDFDSYWTQTETYEALKVYIQMDYNGLKSSVAKMIAGNRITINPAKFQNDMTTFRSADDVLTLLVHLGYLTYDFDTKQVWIPNREVRQEFINCIEDGGWEPVINAIRQSTALMQATLAENEKEVAASIDKIHQENTSILQYNDENSLACVIALAYYSAQNNYNIYRELPSGKGFADLVFVPIKYSPAPAMVVELKWDKTASGALDQIHERNYMEGLKDYSGEILLVGINYSKDTKVHECKMKKITKQDA